MNRANSTYKGLTCSFIFGTWDKERAVHHTFWGTNKRAKKRQSCRLGFLGSLPQRQNLPQSILCWWHLSIHLHPFASPNLGGSCTIIQKNKKKHLQKGQISPHVQQFFSFLKQLPLAFTDYSWTLESSCPSVSPDLTTLRGHLIFSVLMTNSAHLATRQWPVHQAHRGFKMCQKWSSWWLNQPSWKIWSSNWESSPRIGVKIKNVWNHHLVIQPKQ